MKRQENELLHQLEKKTLPQKLVNKQAREDLGLYYNLIATTSENA